MYVWYIMYEYDIFGNVRYIIFMYVEIIVFDMYTHAIIVEHTKSCRVTVDVRANVTPHTRVHAYHGDDCVSHGWRDRESRRDISNREMEFRRSGMGEGGYAAMGITT